MWLPRMTAKRKTQHQSLSVIHWIFSSSRYCFRLSVFLLFFFFFDNLGLWLFKWPSSINIHVHKISRGHLWDVLPSSRLTIIGDSWRKLCFFNSLGVLASPAHLHGSWATPSVGPALLCPRGETLTRAEPTSTFSRSRGLETERTPFSFSLPLSG